MVAHPWTVLRFLALITSDVVPCPDLAMPVPGRRGGYTQVSGKTASGAKVSQFIIRQVK